MVGWVFFDVDQTLCDFATMMRRALESALGELQRRLPAGSTDGLTVEDLRTARDAVAATASASTPMEQIRLQSFRVVVAGCVPGGDEDLARSVTRHYLRRRFADPVLYPDVRPALDALAPRHRLGVVSNGNSYPHTLGLGHFREVFLAQHVGLRKPDPALYVHVAREVRTRPEDLVMVGDSLGHDVLAAREAGWQAVWVNRQRREVPPEVTASVADLRDLEVLLGGG
ncbi:HAD family hydrolase [Oryzihumus sp.]|uniref:HAD family hydrolase n=1 Tax=Oryzihumus sp. TaxID=1968903 RepID=UPI002EDB53B1